MMAGQLNEVIKLYHPVTIVNDYGEREETFEFLCETRAKKESTSGTRVTENNEIVFNYNKKFYVRSYVPVQETYRIEHDNKMYRILSVDHRREYNDIEIDTELINE